MNTLSTPETESILTLCLMASFADGVNHTEERQRLKSITASLKGDAVDLTKLYQNVLLWKPDITRLTSNLVTPGSRDLAYEMAVSVCDADGVCNTAEQRFLEELRAALDLPKNVASPLQLEYTEFEHVPLENATQSLKETTEAMILRYAIAAGALELLHQTMATVAILPLQSKMVYRIGKERGYELDRRSIGEFIATVGLGVASQVLEGFARRLMKGLGKSTAGKLGGSVGSATAGIAMSFGTTYALGQLAMVYYDSDRSLSIETLKAKYPTLLAQGKALTEKYTGPITAQSENLQGVSIASLIKSALWHPDSGNTKTSTSAQP